MLCKYIYLTSEVLARINTKLGAIVLIVADTSLHGGSVTAVALEGAVDGANGGAEAFSDDWPDILHPIPQRRLEGYQGVAGYCFGGVESVKTDALACWPVVEVP